MVVVDTDCTSNAEMTMDNDIATAWNCGSNSTDGWWLRYKMEAHETVVSFGYMPVGDRVHDPLTYDIAKCGDGVDIGAACGGGILGSCNSTIGQTNEQTCEGWPSNVVSQYWGLHITSTGGGLPPLIREVYWLPTPAVE
ncbi:hypothetical protein CYMTET_4956 [Cymbomonas tetramitiformis]|uniref:Uncharacterized protein n=1 Tax=Cymbomonas tetramitiformis TaxID=36881 RepID=A0AAE0H0C1_9CHLO|nr:hypothetical protein CYMTET_4956 [Cymbomonas tetramitiformis]